MGSCRRHISRSHSSGFSLHSSRTCSLLPTRCGCDIDKGLTPCLQTRTRLQTSIHNFPTRQLDPFAIRSSTTQSSTQLHLLQLNLLRLDLLTDHLRYLFFIIATSYLNLATSHNLTTSSSQLSHLLLRNPHIFISQLSHLHLANPHLFVFATLIYSSYFIFATIITTSSFHLAILASLSPQLSQLHTRNAISQLPSHLSLFAT